MKDLNVGKHYAPQNRVENLGAQIKFTFLGKEVPVEKMGV